MAKDKEKASSSSKGDAKALDFAAARAYGHASSAGVAVGVDRLGCLALTTGRMCLTKSCDPLLEGDATSSDMTAAGR
jgi:elongation factor P--beta-lysine ligase